jgi:hypothetical protein
MAESKFLDLGKSDILKGILMAFIVPAVTIIKQSLDAGAWVFDWKVIATASLAGGLGYLLKNFLTPLKEEKKV